MAKRSGSQLLDLALRLADKSSADSAYRTLALDWFNLVLDDLASRQISYHWRWLEKTATTPTVSGQHAYDLPADCDTNKILNVYDRTNDITLKYVDYNTFVKYVADPSADAGDATLYTFFAGTLRLYPVPDSAVTIYLDYVARITKLADDAVTIELPEKYEDVLIQGFLKYAYGFDRELGDYTAQVQIYEKKVDDMIRENGMMPGETVQGESHRTRYLTDGKKFPLEDF